MKNVEKKRRMSRVFSLLLTGGLIVGSFACTWAATTHGDGTTDAEVALTKNFMVPEGVSQPAASFEFSYTKDGVVSGASAYNSIVTADSTQPDLTALDDDNDIAYEAGQAVDGTSGGKDVYVKTISNIVPADTEFSHAGEYVYTITEDENTNSELDDSMTYSLAEYKMHVFVKNTSDGLLVAGVAVYQTKNNAGETGTNAKVNLDDDTLLSGEGGNDFEFTNLYAPADETLKISKTVNGDYADKSKSFKLSITLTNPSTSTTSEYKAVIVDAGTQKPIAAELESFTPGTATDVNLKTGQELIFVKSETNVSTSTAISDDDAKCMPAGLTYTVVADAASDYTHSATITHGGTADNTIPGTAGESLSVSTNTIVDTGTNIAAMDSEYRTIAVTGLIIRVLPAIIMIIIAGVGLAISIRTRKRV